jgi:hypothetical protein
MARYILLTAVTSRTVASYLLTFADQQGVAGHRRVAPPLVLDRRKTSLLRDVCALECSRILHLDGRIK